MNDSEPVRWTLFGALGWIACRSRGRAAELDQVRCDAFHAAWGPRSEYEAMCLTIKEQIGIYDADPWPTLRQALRSGAVFATGKYRGSGLSCVIPALEWDVLDIVDCFYLNVEENHDYVAADRWIYGGGSPGEWWSVIRLSVSEIIETFPGPAAYSDPFESTCELGLDASDWRRGEHELIKAWISREDALTEAKRRRSPATSTWKLAEAFAAMDAESKRPATVSSLDKMLREIAKIEREAASRKVRGKSDAIAS